MFDNEYLNKLLERVDQLILLQSEQIRLTRKLVKK